MTEGEFLSKPMLAGSRHKFAVEYLGVPFRTNVTSRSESTRA